jgi:hypothetical protein
MRAKAATLSFALLTWLVALGQTSGAEEQPRARHDWQVRVEAGLFSVALDQAPAGEVFSAVADQGKIVLQLDRTLLAVPLTDRFERLSLEQGLRRLIDQLRSQNFRIDFAAGAGGEPRVKRVDIFAASGPGKFQTFSAASADQTLNGVEKKDRPLNQGERARFEKNGGLPGVPKGLQRKAERKGKIPPGNAWRFERAAQILGTDTESLVKTDLGEAPSDAAGEGDGAR